MAERAQIKANKCIDKAMTDAAVTSPKAHAKVAKKVGAQANANES